tara:strand:+ start:9860 stop:10708 length:849 start_codon:yes stop_codon:yes gene_type:complete
LQLSHKFSVVTIVKGRHQQLANLIHSIENSTLRPTDMVVVWMDEKNSHNVTPSTSFLNKNVYMQSIGLPLAKARNTGVKNAQQNNVIFIDVDCICSPTLFENLLTKLTHKLVVSAKAKYLPYVPCNGNYELLVEEAVDHPKRKNLPINENVDFLTFWSLIFAINKRDFNKVNGFDEQFIGYGAEDTDFAMQCKVNNIKLNYIDDWVLHQYHDKFTPPINYAEDICNNANTFAKKWQFLPMFGWLKKMAVMDIVKIDEKSHSVKFLKKPTRDEIEACRSTSPY